MDPIRRENKIRRMRNVCSHTFQMRKENFMGDASYFVGASEMCGCNHFSFFSFYFYFSFDPYSWHLYILVISQLPCFSLKQNIYLRFAILQNNHVFLWCEAFNESSEHSPNLNKILIGSWDQNLRHSKVGVNNFTSTHHHN